MKRYITNVKNKFDILAELCCVEYVTDVKCLANGVLEVIIK